MSLGVRRINEIPDWENKRECELRDQLNEINLQKEREEEKEKEIEEDINDASRTKKKYEKEFNNFLPLRKKKKRKNDKIKKYDKNNEKEGEDALRKFSVSIGSIASSMDDFEFSNYNDISSYENKYQRSSGKR